MLDTNHTNQLFFLFFFFLLLFAMFLRKMFFHRPSLRVVLGAQVYF